VEHTPKLMFSIARLRSVDLDEMIDQHRTVSIPASTERTCHRRRTPAWTRP
jgi:hypothetical protein